MKQILLSVASVGSEMGGGEPMEPVQLHASMRKIKLAQRFHDPDIDRER
jgi:hypothetical protein